jgi:cation diffusion facilitator family transporter
VPVRTAAGTKVGWLGIIANLSLAAVKAGAGAVAGSQVLLVDAAHSLADALAAGIVVVGFRIAGRPADTCHPYGHGKAESIAGKIVALLLILAGVNLGLWSLGRAWRPAGLAEPGAAALVALVACIVVKEALFRYQVRVARRLSSDTVLASAWDQRADSLSSLVALAGVAGARAGVPLLDPLAGAVVAAMVVRLGWTLLRRFADELMDKFDHPELIRAINGAAEQVPGILRVNAVRARHVGPEVLVDLKIGVDPELTVAGGHALAQAAREAVIGQVPGVVDVLVHVDPEGGADAD